ncbi:MAG: hypothetical protein Roseis2KO_47930 [Roseivirga sp.]
MSANPTNWAKLCRYAAMANVLSIMVFAAALMRYVLSFGGEEDDLSTSLVSFDGNDHLPFLFVAILTLLLSKRMPLRLQQGIFGLNLIMAVYMFRNALMLSGY